MNQGRRLISSVDNTFSKGMHKMDFTVSDMPGNMDQNGEAGTRSPGSLRGRTRWTSRGSMTSAPPSNQRTNTP